MAILTGNPLAGIVTYFGLAPSTAPTGAVDDVSDFLDGVESSEDTDELDGTTFRRTTKNILAGFSSNNLSLSGKWSKEAHAFFSPLRKKNNVNYAYGPAGKESGDVVITGTCNVLSYSGPVATVDGITTFTVELRLNSQVDGTLTVATGATAGIPGSFTPAGAGAPETFAGMTGLTASPATAWTTGQHVRLGDGSHAYWNATAWTAGNAP